MEPPQHVVLSSPVLCNFSFIQASFLHVLKYHHATLFLLRTPVYQQKADSEELPRSTCAINTNVLLAGSIKLHPSPLPQTIRLLLTYKPRRQTENQQFKQRRFIT